MLLYTRDPRTRQAEAGGSQVQNHPRLDGEFGSALVTQGDPVSFPSPIPPLQRLGSEAYGVLPKSRWPGGLFFLSRQASLQFRDSAVSLIVILYYQECRECLFSEGLNCSLHCEFTSLQGTIHCTSSTNPNNQEPVVKGPVPGFCPQGLWFRQGQKPLF